MAEKKTISAAKKNKPTNTIADEQKEGIDVPYFCQKELLAILGTAEPTRGAAPFGDENFEIWAVAVASTFPDVKRIDVQFEMHDSSYWGHEDVKKRLLEVTVPLYMQEQHEEFPTSMKYPIELLTSYRRYFTSSIAYIFALAYHSFVMTGNPKHVAIFGIVMSCDEEYGEQRPCCEYWIGRMEGAGMNVEIIGSDSSVLASPGLYAYENYNPLSYDIRQRIDGLSLGLMHSKRELEKWKEQKAKQEGGIAENEFWLRRFQRGER